MEQLIEQLHEGGYSCVIRQGNTTRTFTQRGVNDLYMLVNEAPGFLHGAVMADKVVGKGAAALMAIGGIKELYADVISESAYEMLTRVGIKVAYGQKVAYIINRTHTDRCPLEKLCANADTPQECLPLIDTFVKNMNLHTHA